MAQSRRLRDSNQRYNSIVARIQSYIKYRGAGDVNFSQNTHGLRITPSAGSRMANNNKDFIFDITFRQPMIQDKILRIRQNVPPIHSGSEQRSLGNLLVGEGDKWLPLYSWIYRHYEDPTIFRHGVKSLLHLESIKNDIFRRQLIDFDFWSRTHGLRICVDTSSKSSPWKYILACHRTKPVKFGVLCKHNSVPILPGTSRLSIEDCDQWQQFSGTVTSTLSSRPVDPTMTQIQWWNSNGFTFRILNLPSELRAAIYRQVTGPYLWPHIQNIPYNYLWRKRRCARGSITMFDPNSADSIKSRWILNFGSSQFELDPLGNRPPPPTCLIGMSKQIKEEFWAEAQRHTIKRFEDPKMLGYYIFHTFRTCNLYRISLGFPHSQSYRFLGFKDGLKQPFIDTGKSPIKIFAKLRALKYLNFHFQVAPARWRDDELQLDPWYRVHGYRLTVSCQKTVVDWFLTLALAHIRLIPSVSISGHVKNSTRSKWESIFEEERQGWQHGPYPQGQLDPRFDPIPYPAEIEYDPRKHDRFNCEG